MVSIDRNLEGVYPRRTKSSADGVLDTVSRIAGSETVVEVLNVVVVEVVVVIVVPGESFSSISPLTLAVGGSAAAFHGTLACFFPGHVAACL